METRRVYLGECGEGCPVRLADLLTLDHVMCDAGSAVVLGRLPAKSTCVLGDVGHGQTAALARHRCNTNMSDDYDAYMT